MSGALALQAGAVWALTAPATRLPMNAVAISSTDQGRQNMTAPAAGAQPTAPFSRIRKLDDIGLFLLLPEAAAIEPNEYKSIKELIHEYEWKLERDSFPVERLPSPTNLHRKSTTGPSRRQHRRLPAFLSDWIGNAAAFAALSTS